MATALTVFLILHIVSGFTALTTGFISMLNKKGAKQHRLTGKMFFAGMTGVFITATFIAIAKGLAFLFMVGFFSYYLACSGYRVLYLKKLYLNQKPKFIDWLIGVIGIIAGVALITFSISWFNNRGSWGFVPLSFGGFCLLSGLQDISSFFYKPQKLHWLKTHATRMAGSFAATVTAFTVVNVSIGGYTWILWILPGVVVTVWKAKILKRFLKPKIKTVETPAVAQL